MKTASWWTYAGPGRVGLSLGTRGVVGGYRNFRPLAPTRDMLHMGHEQYEVLYAEILSRLDPRATWDQLHELAGDGEPHLMCHERPPFTDSNRCHRRPVAAWFEATLGEVVPELLQPALI
jgi:hypothetical protein